MSEKEHEAVDTHSIATREIPAKHRRGSAVELDPANCDIFQGNGRALTAFDPAANAALVKDIERNGQQTPVVVRQRGDRYEVIAGTRRLGSVLEINKTTPRLLKAIVVDVSDQDAWDMADKENANRRDLTPLQRARAWAYAIDTLHGGRQDHFAKSIDEDASVISRTLALLKIPDDVMIALKQPERVSVHFATQLVPALQDNAKAKSIRENARNLVELRGPMSAPDLLDALLSAPADMASRATVYLGLKDIPNHSCFRRKRDGSAVLGMKAIDGASHDVKSRKALLNAITSELRIFLQLELRPTGMNSAANGLEQDRGGQGELDPARR